MEHILFLFSYLIYFSVFYKYRTLFLSVFDRNASYLFDLLFLLIFLFYFLKLLLLVSLLNWIISKLLFKFSIKSWEYIPKVFPCKKYNFHLNTKSISKVINYAFNFECILYVVNFFTSNDQYWFDILWFKYQCLMYLLYLPSSLHSKHL